MFASLPGCYPATHTFLKANSHVATVILIVLERHEISKVHVLTLQVWAEDVRSRTGVLF